MQAVHRLHLKWRKCSGISNATHHSRRALLTVYPYTCCRAFLSTPIIPWMRAGDHDVGAGRRAVLRGRIDGLAKRQPETAWPNLNEHDGSRPNCHRSHRGSAVGLGRFHLSTLKLFTGNALNMQISICQPPNLPPLSPLCKNATFLSS